MPNRSISTDAYGRAHRARREQLLAQALKAEQSGSPMLCERCGEPLLSWQQLDLGHSIDLAVDAKALGDRLEHSSCNRKAGAELGNAMRTGLRASREW